MGLWSDDDCGWLASGGGKTRRAQKLTSMANKMWQQTRCDSKQDVTANNAYSSCSWLRLYIKIALRPLNFDKGGWKDFGKILRIFSPTSMNNVLLPLVGGGGGVLTIKQRLHCVFCGCPNLHNSLHDCFQTSRLDLFIISHCCRCEFKNDQMDPLWNHTVKMHECFQAQSFPIQPFLLWFCHFLSFAHWKGFTTHFHWL